jgi:hypothetical protein
VYSYDPFLIRIEPYSGPQRYEVYCAGRTGEGHALFDLPFDRRDIENFVLRMSRGRRGTRHVGTSDTRRAEEFGRDLFTALFTGEIRDLYRTAYAEARREERGIRITLQLTKVPELMDVPWEYLHDDPDFLSVSPWTPIVRYLDISHPRPPLAVESPLRVLGMVSDVSDMAPLDTEGERARLETALAPMVAAGQVELHWADAATLPALLRALRGAEFHVFHFVGHGAYDEERRDGVLLLEDDDGRSLPISGKQMGAILRAHRWLRLAVLNACEGARSSDTDPFAGVAASLVRREIPAVVAMQFEITDEAALLFAEHFYKALVTGAPVDAAVAQTRQDLFASGNEVEWGTPVLFMRPSDGRIFDVQGFAPGPEPASPARRAAEVEGDGRSGLVADPHSQAAKRPSWVGRTRRWAFKLGATIAAAFLAWFVPFVGPDLVEKVIDAVGGEQPPLSTAVVTAIARFTSPADESTGPPLFLYSGPVAQLGAPPGGEDPQRDDERWAWAHERGAVDALNTLVRMEISGTSSTPVILNNIRVSVVRRRPPLDAWLITYPSLGSAQGVRYFDVDLDRRPPSPEYVGERTPLPLRVTDTDVEVIDLLAGTLRCDCEWEIKLDWVSGSSQGTMTIDDHGQPFRTSGVRDTPSGEPSREIVWNGGRWMRLGPTGRPIPLP